jgi:hypothetical protein
MAGTGETPETGAPGPKGWIGTSRTYNEEGTEIETEMIAIFLSLDQAKQWARKMADIARDDNIEEKLPGLSRKPWPLDITIGADPQPAEEGNEEAGGTTQFEVRSGIQVLGELPTGGRRKRKTLRRRRIA